jgi:hypothetical protein
MSLAEIMLYALYVFLVIALYDYSIYQDEKNKIKLVTINGNKNNETE